MKLVFASDSFKGSLSSKRISEILTRAAGEVFGGCECVPVILADGGEGTLDALLSVRAGRKVPVTAEGPLYEKVEACYGVFENGAAIVEMAQASGLTLVPAEKRNPLKSSSIGTGQLIREALQAGYRNLTVAIGGSATNDGGLGMAQALGIRFLDRNGDELKGCGANLENVDKIDTSGLIPEARSAQITVMCDVKKPLCGENGATYTYGPQKGATTEMLKELEAGMQNYRDVILREYGIDPDTIPGAGAAGGSGAALKIFLNAELRSGIETVLDLADFDLLIRDADYVITGEGRIDGQSLEGKAVQGVGLRAKKAGIPCIALCGCAGEGYERIRDYGITRIETLADATVTPKYAMEHAEEVYYRKAMKIFEQIRKGATNGF